MKISLQFSCFCLLTLTAFSALAQAEVKPTTKQSQSSYNIQDRPNPEIDNPIKGLTSFLFFPMYPAKDKKMADNIFALVEKMLSQYGQVNKTKILVETDQGEAVELSVFKTGVTLLYKIQDVKDLSGSDTGMVRASLNLTTAIEVEKTKEICSPYIWSCNCFVKGSIKKDLEKLISLSLDKLLAEFNSTYNLVNTDKPVFELQGAN